MKITDARIAELVVQNPDKLTLDESEELIWLIHDKLRELNDLPRYKLPEPTPLPDFVGDNKAITQCEEEKPDEGRLLPDKVIEKLRTKLTGDSSSLELFRGRAIAKAQDARTAAVKDTEIKYLKEDHQIEIDMLIEDFRDKCQKRVEEIFKVIEEQIILVTPYAIFSRTSSEHNLGKLKEWQALKERATKIWQ